MKKSGFFWHVHHKILLEWCHGYDERVAYIRTHKTSREQELRLRLFQPVKGQLPQEVVEARNAYDEAWNAYDEAWKAYDEAREAYLEAREAFLEAGEAFGEAREAFIEAGEAHLEAPEAYLEAGKFYNEAGKAYRKTLFNHKDEIEALHADECRPDCPWDGETIFPAA